MKRFISLLLAIMMLCTPVCAFSLADIPDIPANMLNNPVLKEAVQGLVDELQNTKESFKDMTDEELEALIRSTAEKYKLPAMNDEQIKFLVNFCRSFETAEELGDAIEEYQETAENIGETVTKVTGVLNTIREMLDSILEKLQGILDMFSGESEPA